MRNDLQDKRRRQSAAANFLSKDSLINLAFSEANKNYELFSDVFEFLSGSVLMTDFRMLSEKLQPEKIRERIKNNISDESIKHWLNFSLKKSETKDFLTQMQEIKHCIGGFRLASSLLKQNLIREFFLRYLSFDIQKLIPSTQPPSDLLSSLISGSEEDAIIAAEIVYEFIGAIRDIGDEKLVLLGFFEGFSVETNVKSVFTIKWNSAPMLQALIKANKLSLVHLHNSFIKTYLGEKMRSDSLEIGEWQKQYDQQFQLMINLQSGMFNPGATYIYGEMLSNHKGVRQLNQNNN